MWLAQWDEGGRVGYILNHTSCGESQQDTDLAYSMKVGLLASQKREV